MTKLFATTQCSPPLVSDSIVRDMEQICVASYLKIGILLLKFSQFNYPKGPRNRDPDLVGRDFVNVGLFAKAFLGVRNFS